jgi:hypothetical protein
VHLVLDTSAVVAHARGSEHVGEPLTQVLENGAAFTVPLNALASAAARAEPAMVDLQTKHAAFEPVDSRWSRWPALAATFGLLGRLDAADALLWAIDFDCDVLTAGPAVYGPLGDDPPIITV